jgi:hypothetical protein
MAPMPTTTTTTSTPKNGSGRSPCGCPDIPPSEACCCNLVCFDRPNYFCGHLLTDADLTLQQKYVVEKNKLYHRTMDGYGIVCGLKLTCDCDCQGNILIHDGFAIDDCGNDLVVCETTRFPVIDTLKSKGLLVYDEPEDECKPERRESRCPIKQCFYITICYSETESDYETPFQSSCTSGPKQCMPTRIHEGVHFDVTHTLPHRHSYLDDLEERLRYCFEIYCDGPIGKIMSEEIEILTAIVSGKEYDWQRACHVFCTLRAYFLNHLKVKCDQFNCSLENEVLCLTCPEVNRNDPKETKELQTVFRKLITLMAQHQFDCAFGDLVFNCQQPCEAHCLVLGTVEVLDGKLIRVCNTPRQYLWAPANLIPVLLYTVLTGRFAGRERDHCCPDYPKFMVEQFLDQFYVDKCGQRHAAQASVQAVRAVQEALHRAFDFTNTSLFSSSILRNPEAVEKAEKRLNVHISTGKPEDLGTLNPLQALQASMLLPLGGYAVAYGKSEKEIERVLPDYSALFSPDSEVTTELRTALSQADQITGLNARIEELTARLAALEDQTKKGPKKKTDE